MTIYVHRYIIDIEVEKRIRKNEVNKMILGYHERKDLRLELTVKNIRTREIVNLEKLVVKPLILCTILEV